MSKQPQAPVKVFPDGRKRYRWIGDKKDLIEHFKVLAGRIRRTP